MHALSDNAANLDPGTLSLLYDKYRWHNTGGAKFNAEILDNIDGALWDREMLDTCRVSRAPRSQSRVVIAIDPSGGSDENNAECGIIVACRGFDDAHGYILADASAKLSPERWARRALDLSEQYGADMIVAEQNFGGAIVRTRFGWSAMLV